MMQLPMTALLWFSAIGCGLLAGLYFAFSAFIMAALARIEPGAGIAAMNAINTTIVQSLFMPFFLGTTLVSAALPFVALRFAPSLAPALGLAALIYVVGMFGVTVMFNLPLNNQLAALSLAASNASAVWTQYLEVWTNWNHARTLCSTAALALYIGVLAKLPG